MILRLASIILEVEIRSKRSDVAWNDRARALEHLTHCHLGRWDVLAHYTEFREDSDCEVPFFGYNHESAAVGHKPAYQPELGVKRWFGIGLLLGHDERAVLDMQEPWGVYCLEIPKFKLPFLVEICGIKKPLIRRKWVEIPVLPGEKHTAQEAFRGRKPEE